MSLFCRVTIKYKSAYASKIKDKSTNKVYLPLFECEYLIKKTKIKLCDFNFIGGL